MIVYLIFAHMRLGQLARLVDRLRAPDIGFLIHIDARTRLDADRDAMERLAATPALQMVPRHRCPWGGFGIVEATLAALSMVPSHFSTADKVCVLTGLDYPLRPPSAVQDFFSSHPGASFIEHWALPREDWEDGGLWRVSDYHVHLGRRRLRIPLSALGRARELPEGVRPYQGGQCWTMSADCAAHVCRVAGERAELRRFFRRTAHPDESFFQSIVMSSPFAGSVVGDDLRFEKWTAAAAHPKVLTSEDFPELARSDRLFAKKFDVQVDAAVLDRIDQELLGRGPEDARP